MPILEAILDQDCALCGGRSPRLLCGACEAALDRCGRCFLPGATFDDALAAFDYRFPLDRLMLRFKFGGDLAIGRWLAHRLAELAGGEPRPDLIVAPPSERERLRARGFNPALEVAKVVGRRTGVRCELDALSRTRKTAPQPGLGRAERRRNLEGAFDCRLRLAGMHVALVDDVLTTGATADAAAAVLKRAGASRVSLWVVARAP
jgi:ComF family protein